MYDCVMNIAQVLRIFQVSRMVSVQKVEEGVCWAHCLFQFAVYNSMNYDYKIAAIMD